MQSILGFLHVVLTAWHECFGFLQLTVLWWPLIIRPSGRMVNHSALLGPGTGFDPRERKSFFRGPKFFSCASYFVLFMFQDSGHIRTVTARYIYLSA